MATERNIRVSDADREAVAAQLREHYALGRLTRDELNERLDRTFASRTNLELAAVTSDLPYVAPHGLLPSDRLRQGGWAGPGGSGGSSWSGRERPQGSVLAFLPLLLAFCCLLIAVSALGFGLGSGPSLVVILLGVLAVLRRLFGRRRRWPGPPVRTRRGRRW